MHSDRAIGFPGNATGWFAVLALFPVLRSDSLGSLRRRQSTAPPRPFQSRVVGFPLARLFTAHQRPPLRLEIADP